MLIYYFMACIMAYLIGSIPTAYLIVKWRFGQDISQQGSGNIGTFNVLRTTKSKYLALSVLLIDLCKGLLVMWLADRFFTPNHLVVGIMAVLVVIGHNYPVWLRFHGGRGLAASAGVTIYLAPILLLVWLLLMLTGYYLFHKVIIYGSIFATISLYVFLWFPREMFVSQEKAIIISVLGFFILLRHISRFKEVLLHRKQSVLI